MFRFPKTEGLKSKGLNSSSRIVHQVRSVRRKVWYTARPKASELNRLASNAFKSIILCSMVDHAPHQPYTCLILFVCFELFRSFSIFSSIPQFSMVPHFCQFNPQICCWNPRLTLNYISSFHTYLHFMVKTCGKRQFHGKFSGFHHEKNLKSQSSPRFDRFPQPSPPSPPWRPRPRRPRCGTRSDAGRCCGGIRSCSGCGERMDGACRHAEELGKQIGWEDVWWFLMFFDDFWWFLSLGRSWWSWKFHEVSTGIELFQMWCLTWYSICSKYDVWLSMSF